MRGRPSSFWGKLSRCGDTAELEWHPLEAHCADVAACCEALLHLGLTHKRLAFLAGLDDLTERQVARLCVLAGMHDLGKFNHGFQAKADPAATGTAGHVKEALALLEEGGAWAEKLGTATGYERMLGWTDDEQTLFSYLRAVISHHGQPQGPSVFQRSLWQVRDGCDPFTGIAILRDHLEHWFPEAWESAGDLLPRAPEFQHAFFGLVTLADWIASDTLFFPFAEQEAVDRMDLARTKAHEAVSGLWLDPSIATKELLHLDFVDAVLPGLEPRPLQRSVLELPVPKPGSVTVLEAETGAGKTEAALLHFLKLFSGGVVDGLYFALPTRTAATQIHQRVTDAIKRVFADPEKRPPVVMAVPGYLQVDDVRGRKLAPFEVLWNDDESERFRFRGWAAENPKRYLAGMVVVGTIDQVLLSALQVSHSHMRASALLRHLLVIDEVHASDTYMNSLLEEVLKRHVKSGGHAVLMSATLGAEVRARLLGGTPQPVGLSLSEANMAPYPVLVQRSSVGVAFVLPVANVGTGKVVNFGLQALMDSPNVIAELGLEAADQGASVLILRNTVAACIETQLCLESLALQQDLSHLLHRIDGLPVPHHSRYSRGDRKVLDNAIEDHFGKARSAKGRVAVATQTVQQSLDLDADLLITDICPMDVLLQRVGRLHRHYGRKRPKGYENARVVVLTPTERDLGRHIHEKTGEARGAHGLGTVYDDLRIIEATWRQLETRTTLHIPDDCREAVEASVHTEALEDLVGELGGRWQIHQQHVLGVGIAHRQNAHFNLSNWSSDFVGTNVLFSHGADERVKTRLGEGDRRVVFPQSVTSPFDVPFGELTLPYWQTRKIDPDATPSNLLIEPGRIQFSLGAIRFVYDRLGLRRDVGAEE
jgi:CRISPR-associated endonuclease/helicase Cas3